MRLIVEWRQRGGCNHQCSSPIPSWNSSSSLLFFLQGAQLGLLRRREGGFTKELFKVFKSPYFEGFSLHRGLASLLLRQRVFHTIFLHKTFLLKENMMKNVLNVRDEKCILPSSWLGIPAAQIWILLWGVARDAWFLKDGNLCCYRLQTHYFRISLW